MVKKWEFHSVTSMSIYTAQNHVNMLYGLVSFPHQNSTPLDSRGKKKMGKTQNNLAQNGGRRVKEPESHMGHSG